VTTIPESDAAALRFAGGSGNTFAVVVTTKNRPLRIALPAYRTLEMARQIAAEYLDADPVIYRRSGDTWERAE
jgi:hypothetical protein